MQTVAADFDFLALTRLRIEQPRKPCERNADRAAIREVDPHRMLVEPDFSGRNVHSKLFQFVTAPGGRLLTVHSVLPH